MKLETLKPLEPDPDGDGDGDGDPDPDPPQCQCQCQCQCQNPTITITKSKTPDLFNLPNLIRDAALSVWAVNLEESVRLKSWVLALSLCNQRKSTAHLLHSFHLYLDGCTTAGFSIDQNAGKPRNNKKKRVSSDRETAAAHTQSGTGTGTGSGRRERKKSKYLSPPYTDIVGLTAHNPSDEELDDGQVGKKDAQGPGKANLVDLEAFSVQDIFTDFLLTCMHPLYLKRQRSAKVFRFFFNKYRDTVFLQGPMHRTYTNHKCQCQMKGKVKIEPHLDNGSGLSFQSHLNPKIDSSDLTTGHDASRVDKDLEREKGKEKSDNGVFRPKMRGRPRKEEGCLSSLDSNVEKSEQKIESKDLTGSVSSVPFKTKNSIAGGPVLNSTDGSYEFLEGARAQMLKASSLENGNKPAGTGKQFQELGALKKRKTGNSDGTSGMEPKQAHHPNPAALLLDFSKPDVANGTAAGMGAVLPSRDELLSTFSKFGFLVESQSDVHRDLHAARVVFARSMDAETAYSSPDKLGPFGPPFASCRLHYLPPIGANLTPPTHLLSAKPQLHDIRKNLEAMISSLTGGSALNGIRGEVRGSLVEEMQGLLMKVEKRLEDLGASSGAKRVV
jgi:hypothetical protein